MHISRNVKMRMRSRCTKQSWTLHVEWVDVFSCQKLSRIALAHEQQLRNSGMCALQPCSMCKAGRNCPCNGICFVGSSQVRKTKRTNWARGRTLELKTLPCSHPEAAAMDYM